MNQPSAVFEIEENEIKSSFDKQYFCDSNEAYSMQLQVMDAQTLCSML
jgi:hypothetical protein